ncbi:MAG: phosphoenolpyruvate phosphomutase, partial [Defluviitaleaceae bacterium]|nr:phosphoenolpyruvate phosphomutase [Defluviitaleaceae bacterium]
MNFINNGAGLPDVRRPMLRNLLEKNGPVRILEAHSGLSALIVENAKVETAGAVKSFDGMW